MGDNKVIVHYNKREILREPSLFERIWNDPELLQYSEKDIIEMICDLNKHMTALITETREGVALPLYMGVLMSGTWGKGDMVDYVTSEKIGKKVTYNNHHSDGYGGRVYYITELTKQRFSIGKLWGFMPTHAMSKNLKKGYMTNWKLYANIPNAKEAFRLYKNAAKKDFARGMAQETIKDYDEFDFDS